MVSPRSKTVSSISSVAQSLASLSISSNQPAVIPEDSDHEYSDPEITAAIANIDLNDIPGFRNGDQRDRLPDSSTLSQTLRNRTADSLTATPAEARSLKDCRTARLDLAARSLTPADKAQSYKDSTDRPARVDIVPSPSKARSPKTTDRSPRNDFTAHLSTGTAEARSSRNHTGQPSRLDPTSTSSITSTPVRDWSSNDSTHRSDQLDATLKSLNNHAPAPGKT